MDNARLCMLDDSDENFLLDDDGMRDRKSTCHGEIVWTNATRKNQKWGQTVNGVIFNGENGAIISTTLDEQNDNLEDSPLLINESFRESGETDYHCHDFLETVEDVNAWKKLSTAALMCFLFMLAEFIGGYIAGSLAVMTDAAHLFSDFIGFLISLLAIWIGKRPPSKNMTFGYYRAEVIGALLSVLTIWLLAAIFSTLAINRLYNEDYQIQADTMIIIASIGLIINIVIGGILHGVCHTHAHLGVSSHTHHSNNNINVRAAAIHVLGDFLQSVGVLIAALIIKFYPEAKIADPICTLIFSLIVICTTIKVGKDSIWFLIEGSPVDTWQIKMELKKLPPIKHIHNLHVWSLAPGKNAAAVHLAVDQYCDRDLLLKKATSVIQSQISVVSCTVQVESFNFEMINSCQHCQNAQC